MNRTTKTFYEPLPDVVQIRGCGIPKLTATKVLRNGKWCMYERWDNVWEVFRVQTAEEGDVFGTIHPAREVYPCNEDFGKTAWCYSNKDRAEQFYSKMAGGS